MCEVRAKRWLKYIKIFILGELSYQGCRKVLETYTSKLYTKSYMRIPCSIYWNTISFTIFDCIIWYRYKPNSLPIPSHVWHMSWNENRSMCNPTLRIKIYQSGLEIMHQWSCTSIVFCPLQSKVSFCVSTWWMSALGRRSAILANNT